MLPKQSLDSRRLMIPGSVPVLSFLVFLIASIAIMFADQRFGYLEQLRSVLISGLYPLQRSIDAPFSAARWISDSLTTNSRLRQENARLVDEIREMRLRQNWLDALEMENARLRSASQETASMIDRYLVAELLRVGTGSLRHRVIVNRGTKDGVYEGQPALDAHGVFGQVTRVGSASAEIIMISDPAHSLSVLINRTSERTLAYGTGDQGNIVLRFLPSNADVMVGDLVVTSGLGGVFPRGYPVGKVMEVMEDPGGQGKRANVQPLARLTSDPEVLLVWYDKQEEELFLTEPTDTSTNNIEAP